MKRRVLIGFASGLCLMGAVAISHAGTIPISLAPSDWEFDASRHVSWQAPSTISSTSEGLKVTIDNTNPGSPKGAYYWSKGTFNMQGSTFQYKWKAIPANNSYANYWNGFDAWTLGNKMTTSWSFAGSTIIDSNRWIYTEVSVGEDLSYHYNFSYDGYASSGGFRSASGTMGQTGYDNLADVHFRSSVNDNRTYNAGFVIAEANLIKPDSGPATVPEPTTMLLFGVGLISLAGLKRKRK